MQVCRGVCLDLCPQYSMIIMVNASMGKAFMCRTMRCKRSAETSSAAAWGFNANTTCRSGWFMSSVCAQ